MIAALGRAIYWTLGAAQAIGEGIGVVRRLVRSARKGVLPMQDDTQPIPLTRRDAERIAQAGRSAGHERQK